MRNFRAQRHESPHLMSGVRLVPVLAIQNTILPLALVRILSKIRREERTSRLVITSRATLAGIVVAIIENLEAEMPISAVPT